MGGRNNGKRKMNNYHKKHTQEEVRSIMKDWDVLTMTELCQKYGRPESSFNAMRLELKKRGVNLSPKNTKAGRAQFWDAVAVEAKTDTYMNR